MTFQDIFKKAFLENVASVSIVDAGLSMVLALVLGFIIFQTYRLTFSGVIYSRNYNVSLMAITVITSVIVITLASNVVLSLGMVGALSIVRFRTAVKEPLDVIFMFWAITIGIVCGAGLFLFAVIATLFIALLFFLMSLIKEKYKKFMVIINYDKTAYKEVQDVIEKTKYIMRSRTITNNDIELVAEMDIKGDKNGFINRISEITGVTNVAVVNYKAGL